MLCYYWHISQYMKGEADVAIRKDSADSKKRILSACVKLFIEKGYAGTTMAEIISEANVSNSTFQNLFHSKSGVLMDLVEFMFSAQFKNARTMVEKYGNPVYVYALETSIQMALAEINENLRDIYIEAYTFPESLEYIQQRTASELYKIFSSYRPDCTESDFYELEIGTSGIMRSYMSKPCDMYFTFEKKLSVFLNMTLGIYGVGDEERRKITENIVKSDIKSVAKKVMQELFEALAMMFNFELIETEGKV